MASDRRIIVLSDQQRRLIWAGASAAAVMHAGQKQGRDLIAAIEAFNSSSLKGADLIALCEAGDHYLAYLRDGGPTTADQADALSATVGRVRAVIGGAG